MLKAKYDFDNLPIQFRVVASNLIDGKVYVFRNGSMAEALRASMAIPMLFTPVEKEDMLLVDGGLADNLPTDVARALGASIIIAVDASSPLLRKEEIRSFINVMDQSLSLRMEQNEAESRKLASIVLKPDLEAFTANDYDKIPEILERGEEEAGNRLEELKALVAGIPFHPLREVQENGSPVIDSLSFRGLKQVKPAQLEPNLRSRPGEAVDLTAIGGCPLIYARLFDSVGYDLEPLGGNRYRLVYVLKEAPLRSLGVGLRYDNDYNVVALAEFTARHLFDSPSRATVSSQFGGLQDHSAALRLISSAAPSSCRTAGTVLQSAIFDEEVAKFTDMREGAQLLMGASLLRQLEIDGGYRIERVRIDHGAQPNSLDGSVVLAGLMLRVNADSLDHPDFPRSGLAVKAQYDKRSRWLGGDWTINWAITGAIFRYRPTVMNASAGYSHGPVFYPLLIGGYPFRKSRVVWADTMRLWRASWVSPVPVFDAVVFPSSQLFERGYRPAFNGIFSTRHRPATGL
jgi:NTE family protein